MEYQCKPLKDRASKAVIAALAAIIALTSAFLTVYDIYGWAFITTEQVKNYKAEIYARRSADAEKGAVVFYGDSLTEMYDLQEYYDFTAHNRGISGDRTDHMLERLGSNLIALQPSAVVFLGGCNDLRHGSDPEQVISNIDAILTQIRNALPDCRIIVESLYPINTRSSGIFAHTPGQCTVDKLLTTNAMLQALCSAHGVVYADIFSLLAGEDGNILPQYVLPDGLHITDEAYRVVTDALLPLLA